MPRRKKPVIEYRRYSLPSHFPVLLLCGERWKISDVKSEHLHFHNCLEIGICHSDSGYIEIEGKAVPFQAGDVTCIPRYLPHTTYSSSGQASLWSYIFFAPEALFHHLFRSSEDNFERSLATMDASSFILSRAEYPKVYMLATAIIDELQQRHSYFEESANGLLLSLYIELMRIYRKQEKRTVPQVDSKPDHMLMISPVLEHIYNHYMEPIFVDDLAELCHLSTTHFRRKFREIMGVSPLEFINSTRIEEACKLLRSTEDSILSISEKVGFQSVSSFNRCFARKMGVSPRTWRKKALPFEAQSEKAAILEFNGWM